MAVFTDSLLRVVKACFWPPLRTATVLVTALLLLEVLGPWVIGANAGSAGILATVLPSSPGVSVLNVITGGSADRAGLRTGDAILAVDGVRLDGRARVSELPSDTFYRTLSGRRPGDEVVLRVQPGGGIPGRVGPSEPQRDLTLALLPLGDVLRSRWFYQGFPWPAVAIVVPSIVVALLRPREVAARQLLVAGFGFGLGMGFNYWPGVELSPDVWPKLTLAVPPALILLACIALLHLFLVFPVQHQRLRSGGPSFVKQAGGLLGLLYVLPLLAGATPLLNQIRVQLPDNWFGLVLRVVLGTLHSVQYLWWLPAVGALLVFCSVVLVHSLLRAETPLVRAQVKWILWGTAMLAVYVILGLVSGVLQITGLVPYYDWNSIPLLVLGYALTLAFPVSLGVAILRLRMLDIDLIINRTVAYGAMTVILGGIFLVASVLSQTALEAATGQRSELITSLAALAMVATFRPVHRRTRVVVDRFLPPRQVLVLLFTDIVGSTERAVQLGDERWREALETYRSAVRRQLKRFGGSEIDTAGDGFFATFTAPLPGVRCGQSIAGGLGDTGLATRAGLHLGECEMRGEKVSGVNLHVASRIMALAGPGEVLVSEALCEWLADAGLAFNEHGVHQLKGVPGEWRLYAVTGT